MCIKHIIKTKKKISKRNNIYEYKQKKKKEATKKIDVHINKYWPNSGLVPQMMTKEIEAVDENIY